VQKNNFSENTIYPYVQITTADPVCVPVCLWTLKKRPHISDL